MTTVAVTPRSFRATPGRHHDLLAEHGLRVRTPDLARHLDADEMCRLVDGCHGLIVGTDPVTGPVLDAGPLRAVVKYGSGTDNIDAAAARERGVAVADTRGHNARSVAELTIGLLLALARHIPRHDRRVRAGWWRRETGTELAGRRLGLIGCGAVGREVVAVAGALGLEVVVHDPYVDAVEGAEMLGLDQLLRTADAVSLHAPLTDATRGLLGPDELDRLPEHALVVNTARGGLVDEVALAERLAGGRLAGAAFDSFAAEPPEDSPLVDLETFVSSPHAGAATTEAARRTGVAAVRALLDLLAADPPPEEPG